MPRKLSPQEEAQIKLHVLGGIQDQMTHYSADRMSQIPHDNVDGVEPKPEAHDDSTYESVANPDDFASRVKALTGEAPKAVAPRSEGMKGYDETADTDNKNAKSAGAGSVDKAVEPSVESKPHVQTSFNEKLKGDGQGEVTEFPESSKDEHTSEMDKQLSKFNSPRMRRAMAKNYGR